MSLLKNVFMLPGLSVYLKLRSYDFAHRIIRPMAAVVIGSIAIVLLAAGFKTPAVAWLLAANRYSDGRLFIRAIRQRLNVIAKASSTLLPATKSLEELDARCLILAPPRCFNDRVDRKGVLLASFTATAGKLYASVEPHLIEKLFHVVLEPSSAHYADPAILAWANLNSPVIVQTSEELDRRLLKAMKCNLIPVEYGAGDWINPDRFFPVPGVAKRYDSICVANFQAVKRVHAYLAAVSLAREERRTYKACLVLARMGQTNGERSIASLLRLFELEDIVDLRIGLGQAALNRLYCESKVCVMPSLKEGSNRVIFESICADTPVIVLQNNIGVNKFYVNELTGKLVKERDLATALDWFCDNWSDFHPRRWFVDNLGPIQTTAKLVADLRRLFPEEEWSGSQILVKENCPEAQLMERPHTLPTLSEYLAAVPQRISAGEDAKKA